MKGPADQAYAQSDNCETLQNGSEHDDSVPVALQRGLTETQPKETVPAIGADPPPALTAGPDLEQTIRAWHRAGHSQRGIARALNIDRRKVKRAITAVS